MLKKLIMLLILIKVSIYSFAYALCVPPTNVQIMLDVGTIVHNPGDPPPSWGAVSAQSNVLVGEGRNPGCNGLRNESLVPIVTAFGNQHGLMPIRGFALNFATPGTGVIYHEVGANTPTTTPFAQSVALEGSVEELNQVSVKLVGLDAGNDSEPWSGNFNVPFARTVGDLGTYATYFISGNLTFVPCSIRYSSTVDMGEVDAIDVASGTMPYIPVPISLTCTRSPNVDIILEGVSNTDGSLTLTGGDNSATGAGISIYDDNNSKKIPVGSRITLTKRMQSGLATDLGLTAKYTPISGEKINQGIANAVMSFLIIYN